MPNCCCKCEKDNDLHYCLDCEDVFCKSCSDRIHQEGDGDHSVEACADGLNTGVSIVTPWADEFIFIFALWRLSRRIEVPADYFDGAIYCPAVDYIRGAIARQDAGSVYVLQGQIQENCQIEDSILRFVADVWLRSFVTHRDNMVMVLGSALPVLCSGVVLICLLIPFVSFVYAVLFSIIHCMEARVPHTEFWLFLGSAAESVNVLDFLEDGAPPVTIRRPSHWESDMKGEVYYRLRRFVRIPGYYYDRMASKLETVVYNVFGASVAIRVVCIFVGWEAMVLLMVMLFLARVYRRRNVIVFRQMFASVLVMIAAAAYISSTYKRHAVRFEAVEPKGTKRQVSEMVFWHIIEGLFRISEETLAQVVRAIFFALLLGVPLVLGLVSQKAQTSD